MSIEKHKQAAKGTAVVVGFVAVLAAIVAAGIGVVALIDTVFGGVGVVAFFVLAVLGIVYFVLYDTDDVQDS